jgi:hypothetical protein
MALSSGTPSRQQQWLLTGSPKSSYPNPNGISHLNESFNFCRVLPQLKKLHITGPPAGKIQMFTDESVDIPFTLQNNSNGSDGQEVGEAALKSVRWAKSKLSCQPPLLSSLCQGSLPESVP